MSGEKDITQCPIGVFDSGIGGLTILKEIIKTLPHENIIYYADTANCPYGEKSREEIIRLSHNAIKTLLKHEAKIIVIACNTASTTASSTLRQEFSIPIIATEPAIKPAVENSKTKTIGLLATHSTIESGHIERLANTYGKDVEIIKQIGHGLVDIVENEEINSSKAYNQLDKLLSPMIEKNCDYIVLGCTHYPFLISTITKLLKDKKKQYICVIDTAHPVAKRAEWVLKENNLLNSQQQKGTTKFISSGTEIDSKRIERIFNTLL